MANPYATIDLATEYYPAAASGPDLRVDYVLRDCANHVDRLAPEEEPTRTLSEPITASTTTLPVVELADFPDKAYIILDEERITYTGRSAASGPGTLTGCKRGQYNTPAAPHALNAPLTLMPYEYPEKRRRCELRLFEYLFETAGTITKDQLQGVSTTDYRSTRTVTRMVKQIMGRVSRQRARIT